MIPSSKLTFGTSTSLVPCDPSSLRVWSTYRYERSISNVPGVSTPSSECVTRKQLVDPHDAPAGRDATKATSATPTRKTRIAARILLDPRRQLVPHDPADDGRRRQLEQRVERAQADRQHPLDGLPHAEQAI